MFWFLSENFYFSYTWQNVNKDGAIGVLDFRLDVSKEILHINLNKLLDDIKLDITQLLWRFCISNTLTLCHCQTFFRLFELVVVRDTRSSRLLNKWFRLRWASVVIVKNLVYTRYKMTSPLAASQSFEEVVMLQSQQWRQIQPIPASSARACKSCPQILKTQTIFWRLPAKQYCSRLCEEFPLCLSHCLHWSVVVVEHAHTNAFILQNTPRNGGHVCV